MWARFWEIWVSLIHADDCANCKCSHLHDLLGRGGGVSTCSWGCIITLYKNPYPWMSLSLYFLLIVFPRKTIKTEHGHVKTKLNSTGLLYSPSCALYVLVPRPSPLPNGIPAKQKGLGKSIYANAYAYVRMYVCMHACMYVHYVCMYIYIYRYVYTCIYIYIYILIYMCISCALNLGTGSVLGGAQRDGRRSQESGFSHKSRASRRKCENPVPFG